MGMSREETLDSPVGEFLDLLDCRAVLAGEKEQIIYGEVDDLERIT